MSPNRAAVSNALIELLSGRKQTELLMTQKCTTVERLRKAIADYIENFHNNHRRHSALDRPTPTELETLNTSQMDHA